MENFLRVNNVTDVNVMYGKEVYFTIFPDESDKRFIHKGKLLGYGAYGNNSDHKTFCVLVDRGDGYNFVDYFQDKCFKSREDYEEFKQQRKERCKDCYTIGQLKKILCSKEEHIDVKIKVGNMVYPVNGMENQSKETREPAIVLKADTEHGVVWGDKSSKFAEVNMEYYKLKGR